MVGAGESNFQFVPDELRQKCRQLVERYHNEHGYSLLPDMLWQSQARALIEADQTLKEIFRKASRDRKFKRANESLVSIASLVLALEVLVRDFAHWGSRFPDAKCKAQALLDTASAAHRGWLIEAYVYQDIRFDASRVLTADRQP